MRQLTLSVCGPVQVRLDDMELPGAPLGAKPLALLAYLAIERRAHARDALTTLLWGEFPEAQARASLRQALAHLRRALGDVLVVEREHVRLEADVVLDVAPLLGIAGVGDAGDDDAALALDPRRFLAALRVQRDGGYEEWAEGMRATLGRRHAELLAAAARDAAARLDWARAASLADRWRDGEPLSPDATLLAMEARHLAGQPSEALAAYAAYRTALEEATGEQPAPALRSLAARIARMPAASMTTPAFGVQAVTRTGAPVPLVGRRDEWERLRAGWATVRGGTAGVVVVAGELGSGKSRLVGDFARRAGADGGTVLRGRSREPSSGVPFSTAAELLRSALDAPGFAATDGEWLAEVARLVPEVRVKLPGVPGVPRNGLGEEWRLYEGAVQLLAALAAEHPLLVVLDDVQWCDKESVSLIRVLVERTESLPVLWCLALGTGLAERDANGVRLASALAAQPNAAWLPLAPLSVDDMRALVVAAGADASDAGVRTFAARLHEATGGLPGYALEAVRVLRTAGLLPDGAPGPEHGAGASWRPTGGLLADPQLGAVLDAPTLAAPIRDRILRLGDDGRAILLTITLAGEACTPALLSAVHGISRLRAAAIGDALVERGLARERDGGYRIANLLVAGMLRRLSSDARQREVERVLVAIRRGAGPQPTLMPVPAPEGSLVRATGEWRSSV